MFMGVLSEPLHKAMLLSITHPTFSNETAAILHSRCLCTDWITRMPPKFEPPDDIARRASYNEWWYGTPVIGNYSWVDLDRYPMVWYECEVGSYQYDKMVRFMGGVA